jgi:cytochrome P450
MNAHAAIADGGSASRIASLGKEVPGATSYRLPKVNRSDLDHIPGKKGLPVLGILPEAVFDPLAFARRMYAKYGPVHRFYASGNWNVQLIGPDASELILFDREKKFSTRYGWEPVFGPLFPGGLLLRDLEDHRIHRRAIGSAFKPQQLEGYLKLFEESAARAVEKWSGRSFHFYPALREMTIEVAVISFMGLNLGQEATRFSHAFGDLIKATVAVIPKPLPGTLLRRGIDGRRYLEDFIRRRIPERRSGGGTDLFSQLCLATYDDESLLDDQEIIDHLIFVMAAAHDTLTSGLSSTVYYLARHPEWQREVRDELLGAGLVPHELSAAALGELPVTENVIKEALRLNTPAPIIWRRAVRDIEFGGFHIPAGTVTGANVLLTQRLAEHWPDPERFDPTRFTPENSKDRHRFAWTPFGGGAHMCLGLHHAMMQSKAFLLHLLAEHRVEIASHYVPRWYYWPNCRPLDGLPVTLTEVQAA